MAAQTPLSRPQVTAALARGVSRLMADMGFAPVLELPLGNGRRADVTGVSAKGEIWIIETKSCLEDWRVDQKWPDYSDYCDAFHVAVDCTFPRDVLPASIGLVVADGFGGEIIRPAAAQAPLSGARRKAMLISVARLAATRLLQTGGG